MTAELPDLRVLALDTFIEQEANDIQRTAPLIARLQAEGLLKNPPIVTPLEDGSGEEKYVILDGANRYTSLKQLGYPHILAQVVRYQPPEVTLYSWYHAITGLANPSELLAPLKSIEGFSLEPMDLLHARAGLARRDLLAYVLTVDGHIYGAKPANDSHTLHEQNRLLNEMVNTYKQRGRLQRAITDDFKAVQAQYPDLTGLVIYPTYDPAEVLLLAREGELLPPGLTRHLIQGRALRVNYPLSELQTNDSLDTKNARLRDWLQHKLAAREVRFYGEATYLFDE